MKPCDIPEAIEAALKVLSGNAVPDHCFDYRFKFDRGAHDLYYTPQLPLKRHSTPEDRSSLVYDVGFVVEKLINREVLDDVGRRNSRAVCAKAADEALKLLGTMASTETYGSLRLTARLCKAIHEELRVLVREYEAVATDGGE